MQCCCSPAVTQWERVSRCSQQYLRAATCSCLCVREISINTILITFLRWLSADETHKHAENSSRGCLAISFPLVILLNHACHKQRAALRNEMSAWMNISVELLPLIWTQKTDADFQTPIWLILIKMLYRWEVMKWLVLGTHAECEQITAGVLQVFYSNSNTLSIQMRITYGLL